ncbi:MAG: diaminopimelate dehydrogenase [Candidatus Aenigmarchaeota archaeon]|nr:diaminopimelate dehydrogenase [Candidatus Aenigmarchaeota archaeon]
MAKVAIVGYGNVGKGVYEAILRNDDIELGGIISRNPARVEAELNDITPVYLQSDILEKKDILDADVAILCGGSKSDLPVQGPVFSEIYNTVDSFDTHANIPAYFKKMDETARSKEHSSVISGGWDPGTFSVNRVLADALIPGCIPKGFYGLKERGGLSMGHSDAVRRVEGVEDARQYTHALDDAMNRVKSGENPNLSPGEMHSREVYVVAKKGADREQIENEIISMPAYFDEYETKVKFVSQDDLEKICYGMPHDGVMIAVGETGIGNKASIEYGNQWESNPEATGSILVACARAVDKLYNESQYGAFTMLDIPPAYISPRSRGELLSRFM